MPELKGVSVDLGVERVERGSVGYMDRKREAARLAKVTNNGKDGEGGSEEKGKTKAKGKKGRSEAWSGKAQQKVVREVRREKRKNRRIAGMSNERRAKEEEWRELVEEVKKERAERGLEKAGEAGSGFEDMT